MTFYRYDKNVNENFENLSESKYLNSIFQWLELPSNVALTVKSSNYSNKPIRTEPVHGKKNLLIYLSEDYTTLDNKLVEGYDLVLKCYVEDNSLFIPFPLGYEKSTEDYFQFVNWEDRPIDVFYAGNLNSNRIELYKELFDLKLLSAGIIDRLRQSRFKNLLPQLKSSGNYFFLFSDGFKRGLDPHEYVNLMCQSKIVICPKGFHSSETFRHYEAMRAGCIVLSDTLPDTWMYDRSPIVCLNSYKGILRKAEQLLADKSTAKARHESVLNWWRSHLDPRAVAAFIMKRIDSLEK